MSNGKRASVYLSNSAVVASRRPEIEVPVKSSFEQLRGGLEKTHHRAQEVTSFISRQAAFYLDPPYFGWSLYRYNLNADDFTKIAEQLSQLKGKFILSPNDVPEVREIFRQFKIQAVDLA